MSDMMMINIAVAGVNAVLAVVVGAVFWRNHKQIRSPFTFALGVFALFFVFHNGLLLYHFVAMMPSFGQAAQVFVLGEGLFQTAALGSLAYATLR